MPLPDLSHNQVFPIQSLMFKFAHRSVIDIVPFESEEQKLPTQQTAVHIVIQRASERYKMLPVTLNIVVLHLSPISVINWSLLIVQMAAV